MHFLNLETVDSTNNYVASHATELADMTMVTASGQTAGRGQRGNSWESEPGLNLLFTVFHIPRSIVPSLQFSLSEASALAVVDTLADFGVEALVKWPNDVYVGDFKIAGILIEHSVTPSEIEHSRIGIGINVNQTRFSECLPNPVSLAQLTGRKTDLMEIRNSVGQHIESRLNECDSSEGRRELHDNFLRKLWRADGKDYPFRLRDSDTVFMGRIVKVDPKGPITVVDSRDATSRQYAFKEIEFVLRFEDEQ